MKMNRTISKAKSNYNVKLGLLSVYYRFGRPGPSLSGRDIKPLAYKSVRGQEISHAAEENLPQDRHARQARKTGTQDRHAAQANEGKIHLLAVRARIFSCRSLEFVGIESAGGLFILAATSGSSVSLDNILETIGGTDRPMISTNLAARTFRSHRLWTAGTVFPRPPISQDTFSQRHVFPVPRWHIPLGQEAFDWARRRCFRYFEHPSSALTVAFLK